MSKVSVIIPSRGERFLVPTVRDVLAKATGEIEVIVVLDGGPWPHAHPDNPLPLPDDPRLRVLRNPIPLGMRPAINDAARVATGDFLMKLDGHCAVEEGFDEILTADCDVDWVVVPRRDRLDAERWALQVTGKPPIDAHFLSYPFERPGDASCGLHGTVWPQRAAARRDVLIDDEMSSQGSCWLMPRAYFWRQIGPLDLARYGSFIQEFQEIGLKCWLSGGRVKCNKLTTYLHLHKGRTYGRGYSMAGLHHEAGRDFCTDFWMHDRWPSPPRVHPLRWLVERFWPVPTWPADLDAAFRPRVKRGSVATPDQHLQSAAVWELA